LVVAPATADTLAKFANGLADDFLSTLFLATKAPVVVAPAMNVNMWENEATQKNIATLKARGVRVVEPDAGYLACGMTGPGRLAANESIVTAALEALGATQDLAGETVLVTAGPTREYVDPVRYISNRSSGKMGYALAEAALRRGAHVILITGPVGLKAPGAAEVVKVETAEQMREAVMANLKRASIAIKTAAVADYRPKQAAAEKIKRKGPLTMEFEPTADILAEIARVRQNQLVVGFAAETSNVLAHAKDKLERKQLDMIVANDVSKTEIGFDSDRNAVSILTRDGQVIEVAETTKWEVAHRVLDEVVALKQRKAATIRS
ncbi:MAG TPA: bifunctional phosphopantothenoylcysteine decarboxylase/phosphopantothenate--cysteine ligase CoaBC, partial [Terriglobales bacterium]|nr:bifunctional phosphopantothenoylcysteine decarboxylase/phosphopantothenate--cysteine ligase CoaBC [Terriglobales bacterium]